MYTKHEKDMKKRQVNIHLAFHVGIYLTDDCFMFGSFGSLQQRTILLQVL